MIIDVKLEHIKARGTNCTNCPVALALFHATKRVDCIATPLKLRVGTKWYNAPHAVTNFISLYDRGREVHPFSFELDLTKELE